MLAQGYPLLTSPVIEAVIIVVLMQLRHGTYIT